jgi:hypothetical protein
MPRRPPIGHPASRWSLRPPMSGLPCEACGRPRGRGSRCKECGYDRYASTPSNTGSAASQQPVKSPSAGTAQSGPREPRTTDGGTGSPGPTRARPGHEAPSTPHEATAGRPEQHEAAQPTPSHGAPQPGTQASRPQTAEPANHGAVEANAPAVSGRVVSIAPTQASRDDRPWWVPVVQTLAILPGLVALAVIMTLRAIARRIRGTQTGLLKSALHFGGSPSKASWHPALAAGGLGAILGYRMGRAGARTEYSLIRLTTSGPDVVCRYLDQPSALPISLGDEIALWGTLRSDGSIRSYRLQNRSTGASHKAVLIKPWVIAAACMSILLCLVLLSSVL